MIEFLCDHRDRFNVNEENFPDLYKYEGTQNQFQNFTIFSPNCPKSCYKSYFYNGEGVQEAIMN